MKQNLIKAICLFAVIGIAACGSGKKDQASSDKDTTSTNQKSGESTKETQPNTLSKKEKEEGWKLLFDGESVEHWRGYCKDSFPAKGWKVKNGAIHVKASGQGEAGFGGDIITRKKYKNYEFKVEWKVEKGGNSGIFYLAKEMCGKDSMPIWKTAPEMQLLDNANHPDAELGEDGNRQAGALYDLIPAEPQNFKGANKWNKARILVYQGTVVHYQNDKKVLEYHIGTQDWKKMIRNSKFAEYKHVLNLDPSEPGHIGLQDHGNSVWFRNIKIKER